MRYDMVSNLKQIPETYEMMEMTRMLKCTMLTLSMKPDLERKANLVIGGHVMDSGEHSGYSSVVKTTSICLLNIVVKAEGLECLAGNIGNAYLNASMKEKIYTRCSLEFRPKIIGRIAIV